MDKNSDLFQRECNKVSDNFCIIVEARVILRAMALCFQGLKCGQRAIDPLAVYHVLCPSGGLHLQQCQG
jgi:hypothetical protein